MHQIGSCSNNLSERVSIVVKKNDWSWINMIYKNLSESFYLALLYSHLSNLNKSLKNKIYRDEIMKTIVHVNDF